jgi:hypothetical protein
MTSLAGDPLGCCDNVNRKLNCSFLASEKPAPFLPHDRPCTVRPGRTQLEYGTAAAQGPPPWWSDAAAVAVAINSSEAFPVAGCILATQP